MTASERDLDADKAAARAAAYAVRKAARGADAAGAAAAAMADKFRETVAVAAGDVVSGYRPIRTELDPTPLMLTLLGQGARLCVPVVEGPARPLWFREWTPAAPMVDGAFGAAVPAEGDWVEPTLLIAPLLAFDRAGFRLGYGGGFYDRTLAMLRAKRPTRAIGVAYAAQETPAVPRGATDAPLDGVATETEAFLVRR